MNRGGTAGGEDLNMSSKRILVVDDDPDMCFLVAHAIKSLDTTFQVETANSTGDALKKVDRTHFDLIVTDYMMPGRTGLELISAVSELSADTRYVIMTAHHDTGGVRGLAGKMNVGFVSKPFMLPEIISAVQEALTAAPVAVPSSVGTAPPAPGNSTAAVQPQLNGLLHQTGALSVVLFGPTGSPLLVEGDRRQDNIAKIGALVVGNFRTANEAALLYGDDAAPFTGSYFEGRTLNIYAQNINNHYYLAVIFGSITKPGTVWFYAKQTALDLAERLAVPEKSDPGRGNNVSDISSTFDNLLGGEKT
ncbi:MAG: hypothetical protein Kow0031_39420 [Anaerolineae bacterium]